MEKDYIVLRGDELGDFINDIESKLKFLNLYVYNVDNGSSCYSIIVSKVSMTMLQQNTAVSIE